MNTEKMKVMVGLIGYKRKVNCLVMYVGKRVGNIAFCFCAQSIGKWIL